MKNKEEIEFLESKLDDLNTTIDRIDTFIDFTRFFTNIEDLRKFLIEEYDLGVSKFNMGLKRLNELKGVKHGKL